MSFSTTLTQDNRTQVMTANGCSYVKDLQNDIANGMAFVVSAWGQGVTDPKATNWLTKDRCSGVCNVAPTETIKNISIKLGHGHPSGGGGGGYDPSKFQFGNSCATAGDDDCASESCPSVDHCKWSWPWGESYDGPNAHCRCDIAS